MVGEDKQDTKKPINSEDALALEIIEKAEEMMTPEEKAQIEQLSDEIPFTEGTFLKNMLKKMRKRMTLNKKVFIRLIDWGSALDFVAPGVKR